MRRFLYRLSLAGPSKSSVPHKSIVIASTFTSPLEVRRPLLEVGVRALARLVGRVRGRERVDAVSHRRREIRFAPADDQLLLEPDGLGAGRQDLRDDLVDRGSQPIV